MKMHTSFPASLLSTIASLRRRLAVSVAAACVAVIVSARPADAQVTYTYHGNPFTVFSCGPDPYGFDTCSTPGPNQYTSYTAANSVTATVTLDAALPANMPWQELWLLPGFRLTLTDGIQTLTFASGDFNSADVGVAGVSTDATGRIIAWDLGLGFSSTRTWIETLRALPSYPTYDYGQLMKGNPSAPADFAYYWGTPGPWTFSGSGPAAAVTDLIGSLSHLGLTNGQINSFTTKLNNILTSIDAGLNNQAINQLNAFINQVQAALNTGNISAATAATLIDAANAIIDML